MTGMTGRKPKLFRLANGENAEWLFRK
uniref:Uncharacterized protein n=1 Tax=Anguilla anguilla TaxID=7936 RepID=A0A0E9QDY0_ANGAN